MVEARKYYSIERHNKKWVVFNKRLGISVSIESNFIDALHTVKMQYFAYELAKQGHDITKHISKWETFVRNELRYSWLISMYKGE